MRRVQHCRSSYTLRLVTAATIFVASIFGVVRLTAADDGPRTVENSIGMKLTLIAPGKFMMGTKETRAEIAGIYSDVVVDIRNEQSQHEVRITRPFYLGTYTVTRGQFRKFVAATKYKTDAEKDPNGGWGYTGNANIEHLFEQRPEFNWRNPGFDQTDEHPVVIVSWNDAEAFCAWLSKKEHRIYRLPTEAEWEYACRGGTTTQYFFGDRAEDLAKYANLIDAQTKAKFPHLRTQIFASDGYVFTAPAGSFRPNPFGLYDMHGNVLQLCSDWYDPNYYESSPTDDPQGPAEGLFRVVRGGSWYSGPFRCRSAARAADLPTISKVGFANGFRVAVSFPNNEAVGQAALNGTTSKSPRTAVPRVKGTGSPRAVDPSSADIPGLADAHKWLKAQTKSPSKVAKLLETVDKAAEQRQTMRMLFDSNWMKFGHPEMIYLVHGEFFPFELSKEQFVGLGGKATSMTTGLWPNGGGAVPSPLVKLSDLVIDRIGGEEGEPDYLCKRPLHATAEIGSIRHVQYVHPLDERLDRANFRIEKDPAARRHRAS
jgi:formylglycine-generating enzyme required for sulfatase activity